MRRSWVQAPAHERSRRRDAGRAGRKFPSGSEKEDAMRHLRCAPLAVLAIALCASPAAAAHDPHAGGSAVVTPSSPHQLAQWHKTFLEMPAAVNPLWGTGDDPCVRFGPGSKLLSAIAGEDGTVTCTAELGTVLDTGWGHFCSTFDPPDSEFYAVGRREQRRCARAVSPETGMRVTVDGHTVDIFRPPFTMFSPQTTVQLPADNIFGAAAQTATITAYGWHANVRNLRVGRHLITTEVDVYGQTFEFDHIIDIVPRSNSDDDN
jgi:hypothetical protein